MVLNVNFMLSRPTAWSDVLLFSRNLFIFLFYKFRKKKSTAPHYWVYITAMFFVAGRNTIKNKNCKVIFLGKLFDTTRQQKSSSLESLKKGGGVPKLLTINGA